MKKLLVICTISLGLSLLLASFLSYARTISNYYPSPGGNYTKVRLLSGLTTATFCTGGTNTGTIFADSTTGFLEICKSDGTVASYPGSCYNVFASAGTPATCPNNYQPSNTQPFSFAAANPLESWSCCFTGQGTKTVAQGAAITKSGCFSIYATAPGTPTLCNSASGDPNAYDVGCDTINSSDMTNAVYKRNCCFNDTAGPNPLGVASACCAANCTGKTCGAADGCGGQCAAGSCVGGFNTCGGGGTPDVCGCTPNCTGATCGEANGCGGQCAAGSCVGGFNTCGGGGTPDVCGCTPNCTGAICGAANGCGGQCAAGSCTGFNTCGGGGTPDVCGCTPNCSGASCGGGNGCGGVCSSGSCVSPYDTCGGGGTANVCGCSESFAGTCAGSGRNCGTDSCGASCGSCSGFNTCGGGGTPDVCGCTPYTCASYGANYCGTPSNGCGGTLSCTCSSGSCVSNACELPTPGGWSAWSGWGTCSGAGCSPLTNSQSQTRICNNPSPAEGGADCMLDAGATCTNPAGSTGACLAETESQNCFPGGLPNVGGPYPITGGTFTENYSCSESSFCPGGQTTTCSSVPPPPCPDFYSGTDCSYVGFAPTQDCYTQQSNNCTCDVRHIASRTDFSFSGHCAALACGTCVLNVACGDGAGTCSISGLACETTPGTCPGGCCTSSGTCSTLDSCNICGGSHCANNSYIMTFPGGTYTQSTSPNCGNLGAGSDIGSGCNSTTYETGTTPGSTCKVVNSPCSCDDGHAYPNC